MRTAHKYLEVPSTQTEVLLLFCCFRCSDRCLVTVSYEHLWSSIGNSLLMNPSFKSETNQVFQFHSLFLMGTHLPLDIFHTEKWKLGECIFSYTWNELFKYIDKNSLIKTEFLKECLLG